MDGVITPVDSAVYDEFRPHREVAAIALAIKTKDPNHIADAVLTPIGEFGMAAAGTMVAKISQKGMLRVLQKRRMYNTIRQLKELQMTLEKLLSRHVTANQSAS
eukprot:m.8070 g.8070  ORF g.8070 m.8070 type:complete len:104 (+) comp20307_c0_seq1:148-459(+)